MLVTLLGKDLLNDGRPTDVSHYIVRSTLTVARSRPHRSLLLMHFQLIPRTACVLLFIATVLSLAAHHTVPSIFQIFRRLLAEKNSLQILSFFFLRRVRINRPMVNASIRRSFSRKIKKKKKKYVFSKNRQKKEKSKSNSKFLNRQEFIPRKRYTQRARSNHCS